LTKGRPFKCPDCGSAFARKQELKRHYQRLRECFFSPCITKYLQTLRRLPM
jgi:uncharacterized Zn-finger protein